MNNKMGDTQKMAFLNAMKASKTEANQTEATEEPAEEKTYRTRAERHQQRQEEHVTSTQQRSVTLDDLYDALAEVQDYKSKDFTSETWLPFVNAFTQALDVYQSQYPNRDDIVVAKEALMVARQQLVRK